VLFFAWSNLGYFNFLFGKTLVFSLGKQEDNMLSGMPGLRQAKKYFSKTIFFCF